MTTTKLLIAFWLAAGLMKAFVEPLIVIGKVTLPDGSPPPFQVSIQRECTNLNGNEPGPLTDKKGQWVWRLNADELRTWTCVFLAHHDGYTSTTIDATRLNLSHLDTTVHVPDIVLGAAVPDPYTIQSSGADFPGKSKEPYQKAMKALAARDMPQAIKNLQAAVDASPKFSEAWHALGVVYDKTGHKEEAKDAYMKAIDANPKMLQAYVTLARVCLQLNDWQCAADTSGRMTKFDTKHDYPEMYMHEAVARFELKDLAGAEQSANEMIRLDPKSKFPRIEYVLGRILEAKGDIDGARAHMMKYLSLDAVSNDAEQVQAYMLALGKPEAAKVTPPDLEIL